MAETYTTISVNSSVWTSIPKWTLVAEFQKEDEVTITTVIHFSIAILSEHIRQEPQLSIYQTWWGILLFTQHSFLDKNERKMPTYVRFFYQKGANFHLFVSGLHDKIGAKPKFEFYRPVLTLMDSLYLLTSQGVVNLLILGISCSFTRNTPISKPEGSSTH